MKKTLLSLAIGALLLFGARTASADVSVDFFYNNLSGGSWIDVADYGYCWQPDVAVGNTNWRPYSDGYWAYTDLGWTWVSYEDFGWATYHYGRWALLGDYGWVWVPGRDADLEWGPAWVSWRTGGEYIGWAPLPPETIDVVYSQPISGAVDVAFNIGPAYYNFVDARYIGEPVLRERIVPVAQNVTYIQQTVNVTNITYNNRTVYNYGPDINVVNRVSTRPVQRLRLDREQNVDVASAAKSGGLTKVQGDRLVVAAPTHIARSTQQIAPPSVKTKVAAARVDRGWSAVGDEKAQAEFKQKLKAQKNVAPLGGAAAGQANAAATAGPPTAGAGTEAAGQGGRGRRGQRGAQQATAATSPGASSAASASPAQGAAAETGRRQGRGANRFPQATPSEQNVQGAGTAAGAAAAGAGASEHSENDQGQGRGRGRRAQGPTPAESQTANPAAGAGAAQAEQGRGQGREGRRFQNQPAETGTGEMQGQGRQGRRLQNQPSETGTGDVQGQEQGQGRGRRFQGQPPSQSAPGDTQGQAGGPHRQQQRQGGQGAGQAQGQGEQQGEGRRGGRKGQEQPTPAASPQG